MKYDFDKTTTRCNTNCVKWDLENKDVIPMWVADMDFEVAKPISDAIKKRAEHCIYGYTFADEKYFNSIINWVAKRKSWNINKEWIMYSPGVVPAFNMIINALTQPGDKVIIQSPVYYPFYSAIENNGCHIVKNSLKYENDSYQMDYDDLEQKLKDERVKVLMLCNPHNPVGRVWTRDELKKLGDLCLKYGVTVIADEIHSDLIYKEHKHTCFASISEEFEQNSITCMAPSKTFNIAGLQISSIIIPNKKLRRLYSNAFQASGMFEPNIFGIAASTAAYEQGEEWLEQLIDYLKGNLQFLKEYIEERIPQIKVIEPEGTYLVWVDCRKLGMDAKKLHEFMLDKAKVWFDDGDMFGTEGEGFERINIACPRSILKEALDRIYNAINDNNC